MNRNTLLVVDLDHTIITFDSFKSWFWRLVIKHPLRLSTNLFKFRNLNYRINVKLSSIITFSELPLSKKKYLSKEFARLIYKRIPQEFLDYLDNIKPTRVFLMSASPHVYVEELCRILNFDGQGTTIADNNLYLLKGLHKKAALVSYILENSLSDFRTIGIGNCPDDLPFLEECDLSFNFISLKYTESLGSFNIPNVRNWNEVSLLTI